MLQKSAPRRVVPMLVLVCGIALGLFLLAGIFSLIRLWPSFETKEVDRTGPAVLHSIEDLASYRAATGHFQVVVDLEADVSNIPDWIAGERTMMVASGTVDAEVDFSDLGPGAVSVDEERRRVKVQLPAATLTEARVDNDATYVAMRRRGILDRIGDAVSDQPVDDQGLYQLAEQRLEEAAAQTDLVDTAEDNTTYMLEGLLNGLGFDQVEIVFEERTRP